VGLACTKYGPVLGWVCARCVCFVACRDVQRSSSTAAVRRARTGTAASTVVAKPHSPPESCGAGPVWLGVIGACRYASALFPASSADGDAHGHCHCHGWLVAPPARLHQLPSPQAATTAKAQRKAGAWVEVAGKSAADAACHPLHAGRFGAGDAPRCTPYPRPTASVLVKDPRRSAGASAISPALETDRRKRLGSRR